MSRLLFAAARGARLQVKDYYATRKWVTVDVRPGTDSRPDEWRIHTEDAHLQYGPISSALRELSQDDPPNILIPVNVDLFQADFYIDDWVTCRGCDDELHRAIFLLILAEALADEGL